MNSKIWGKHAWIFLHSVALNYPINPTNKDKDNFKIFFISLQHTLPCEICQEHYKQHLKNIPIDNFLNSRKDLFIWTFLIHNEVNKFLGKNIITIKEAIHSIHSVYNEQTENFNLWQELQTYMMIVLLIIILLYIFLRRAN